jgi:hypothetical protein
MTFQFTLTKPGQTGAMSQCVPAMTTPVLPVWIALSVPVRLFPGEPPQEQFAGRYSKCKNSKLTSSLSKALWCRSRR